MLGFYCLWKGKTRGNQIRIHAYQLRSLMCRLVEREDFICGSNMLSIIFIFIVVQSFPTFN